MDVLAVIGVLIVIVGLAIDRDIDKANKERIKQRRKLADAEKAYRESEL